MPADDLKPPTEQFASELRLALALGLGVVGIVSAFLARRGPDLRWLTLIAWASALLVFGWTWIRPHLARVPFTAAPALAVAVVITAVATRTWVAVPVALAAWTGVAHVLRVGWTPVLAAAVVVLAASAAALPLGAEAASDSLAVLAYCLACLACSTAAADRLRTPSRRLR